MNRQNLFLNVMLDKSVGMINVKTISIFSHTIYFIFVLRLFFSGHMPLTSWLSFMVLITLLLGCYFFSYKI